VESSGAVVGGTYTTGLQGANMHMCACVNVHMYTYTCMYINVSIYMYVHVCICMWCGDVCNAVYTVLPIGIKQEKVQVSENKRGGRRIKSQALSNHSSKSLSQWCSD